MGNVFHARWCVLLGPSDVWLQELEKKLKRGMSKHNPIGDFP